MKTALVVGGFGQDGQLLQTWLKSKDYKILSLGRGHSETHALNWCRTIDIENAVHVNDVVESIRPDEVYYLAAFHDSSEAVEPSKREAIEKSFAINTFGLLNFLDAMKIHAPKVRLFYASSCLVFEGSKEGVLDEQSPPRPHSPYGLSKFAGQNLCKQYREKHGLHASAGIMFNHESPLRAPHFIFQRVIQRALEIRETRSGRLEIGNLSAATDWGYAPDYVEGAWRILQQDQPDDFVIATGEVHTVLEIVERVFSSLGLHWEDWVVENPDILKRKRATLIGDASKLRQRTGWKPSVGFHEMVDILLESALKSRNHVNRSNDRL